MNESNHQQNAGKFGDEIDIFEFCSRLWKAFGNFLAAVKGCMVSAIIFLIRKSLWIGVCTVAGIIIGFAMHGMSRQSYSSLLEGYTGCLDNSKVINHINKLNGLGDHPELLANFLNITAEEAKEVKSVHAYFGINMNGDNKTDFIDFYGRYNPLDTNQMRTRSYVYIQASVYDKSVFPALRHGLLQYVNSNTYINELFRICRTHQQQLINQIDVEIQMLDSLQHSRFRRDVQPSAQLVFLSAESEFRLFHEEKLDLLSRKLQLEKELEFSEEIITIIHDFTPLTFQDNPRSVYLLASGGFWAVIGIFSALAWQERKRLCRMLAEERSGS